MDSAFERRDAAAFVTLMVANKWEGAFPWVEITAPSPPAPDRPGLHSVSVEYSGLIGRRETFRTWTQDPRHDSDIAVKPIANHLSVRLGDWQERQPVADQLREHIASKDPERIHNVSVQMVDREGYNLRSDPASRETYVALVSLTVDGKPKHFEYPFSAHARSMNEMFYEVPQWVNSLYLHPGASDSLTVLHDRLQQDIESYFRAGRLSVSDTFGEATGALIQACVRNGDLQEPTRFLALTHTKEARDHLNRLLQDQRKPELGRDSIRVGPDRVYTHDRLQFTKNDPQIGVVNGEFGMVQRIHPLTRSVTVALDSGRKVVFSPFRYNSLQLGYAETVSRTQGMALERVYVLLETSPSQSFRSEAKWFRDGNARLFLERKTSCPEDREILARLDRAAAHEHTRLFAGQPEQKPEPERTHKYGLKQ